MNTNIFELIAANIESKETKQVSGVIDSITLGDNCEVNIQFSNKKLFLWSNEIKMWSMIEN
jgi:hypothetical protein